MRNFKEIIAIDRTDKIQVSYPVFKNGEYDENLLDRLNHDLHREPTDESIEDLREFLDRGIVPYVDHNGIERDGTLHLFPIFKDDEGNRRFIEIRFA